MSERFKINAAVYLLLLKEGKVLLSRRFNTGYMDGGYSLPAGHLEEGETLTACMRREAEEEVGIQLDTKNLKLVHVMHRKTNRFYIDCFFTVHSWVGEPRVCEPDKCDRVEWFELIHLPDNILPYVKLAIENSQKNILFSELGW